VEKAMDGYIYLVLIIVGIVVVSITFCCVCFCCTGDISIAIRHQPRTPQATAVGKQKAPVQSVPTTSTGVVVNK